jgi:signal transduction histidine kinase
VPNLTVILFLLSFFQGFGQDETVRSIDRLQQQLLTAKDSARVDVLNQLAESYYNKDIKESLSLGEQALELANKLAYYKGIQHAHSILRRIHRRLGNYTVSIEYTLKNLPISEKLGDTLEILDSYLTLGNVYSSMENFKEAQKYLFRAFDIGKKINSKQLSGILNFLGRSYGKRGMYDSGQYYIRAALMRETESPQPGYGLSYMYNNMGEIYYYKKEYDKAIEFFDLSAKLPEHKRSLYGMTFTLNGLGLVYKDLKQYDKAIATVLQSIEICKQNTFRDKAKEGYRILYEIYVLKNDFKSALTYYKEFNLYQDSIFSEDRIQYIDNLRVTYETEKMSQENELLRKDAQLKQSLLNQQLALTWVAIATILFLLIISALLYRNTRQRKKTNAILHEYSQDLKQQVEDRTKELSHTNVELARQNNQLEQFSYIIAHNLRGGVARILGLANLIKGKPFNPAQDQQVVDLIHSSVVELDTTIYDLNGILEIKKGIHSSYEVINFNECFSKIKNILQDKVRESNATLDSDFSGALTCYAIPSYIESILYNLTSNGIKYRAKDRPPKITLKTLKEKDQLILIVSDNGIGMDLSNLKEKVFTLYQRFHHHVEGKGLGLFLVKTQVEALNGTIDIESKVNEGTTFTIRFPLHIKSNH